ncbi:MBOAT family O-acyltransferase [uncultured Alistipes sp.]|uniref:MBOAT family O-acyltransferase n=1 Tax=uncultured Alistipes sp. TaxID=538949 RepID=UPI002639DBCC|nr:MBOAT family O-acyltransferase [uncultured Alistipes sp.]
MLFNSFVFIFVFLPLCFTLYYGLNKLGYFQTAKGVLVVFSLYFYAYFNTSYLPIIVASIIVNYLIGRILSKDYSKAKRKVFLFIGVAFNVGLLGYFKYYDFFISNLNIVFQTNYTLKYILLPLGISFFTFQQLAYIVDNYKRAVVIPHFLDYCNFVTFFPQLIAGPIVLPEEILPQFENPKNRHICYKNLFDGLYIFSIGLAKKVIVADSIAVFVNAGFSGVFDHLSMAEAWLVSLSYTFQLYFDFSGYCDMAIGIGRMFNIKLPQNFNSPYISQNFQEFWKRWHMTLNRFLTQYLYFPLGGSRKGEFRTYLNTLIVFFVSGLWHGAGWTFILWGCAHGIGVVINRIWRKAGYVMPKLMAIFITFFFVNILWVLFRAHNMDQAQMIIRSMFDNFDLTLSPEFRSRLWSIFPNRVNFVLLLIAIAFSFFGPTAYQYMTEKKNYVAKSIIIIVLFVASIFLLSRISTFLYFNF